MMPDSPAVRPGPSFFDAGEAERHTRILGLDPKHTHLRAIHWNAANLEVGDAIHLPPGDSRRHNLEQLQRGGYRLYLLAGGGRDDSSVQSLNHAWAEWDGCTHEEVLGLLREFGAAGLPDPTLVLETWKQGSIHVWWRLAEPCDPDRWRRLMRRLVVCLGSDANCVNPSRLMRLAGSAYWGKAGKPHAGEHLGQARILDAETTETTCTIEELEAFTEAWLQAHPDLAAFEAAAGEASFTPPTEQERAEALAAKGREVLAVRPMEHIEALHRAIPRRVSGLPDGDFWKYPRHRLIACGLRDALYRLYREGSADDPDTDAAERAHAKAVEMMEERHPSRECGWNVRQVLNSSAWLDEGCFWKVAAHLDGFKLPKHSTSNPEGDSCQGGRSARGHGEGTREAIAALQEAMANGLGEVELQALIQELSERHDTSPVALQKVAQAERERLSASAEMEAAAIALKAERDRQELVSNLRLSDLLPTRAADAVAALTRYLPADPLASTLLVLGGFSGVLRLGSEIAAYPATGFIQPLCLFGGVVATSGQKKSPLFRALVRSPVQKVAREIRTAYRLELEKWEAVNSKQSESGSPPIPKPREGRAVTTGYTTEALMGQLAANEHHTLGLLVAMDELDGLFASENAYRGGRGADEQILLETYDGNGQEILRVKDDVERRFDRCHVSIVGGIQPEVLTARVSEGDPRGKWARFCWAPIPRRVCPLPPCDDDGGFQAAAEMLAGIYLQGHRITPQTYRLDPTGREQFRAYEEQCQREALDASSGAVRALRSKAAGKVARIAGVLHVLAIACDEAFGPVVDAQLIERAILLVDFLDGWAAGLHQRTAGADGSSADALMRKVHQLSSSKRAPVTSREVWHRLSKAQRKAADCALIEAAMAQLAHLGVGEVTVSERGAHAYRATGGLPQ